MKIAVFGDIHSNFAALEACLTYCEKEHIEHIAFLGDYISDCPSPQKTLPLLREAQASFHTWFIKGNREEYMLNQRDDPNPDWRYGSAWGSLFHTYNRLTDGDIAWFRELPIYRQVKTTEGDAFEMCHGTPEKARKIVYPDSDDLWEVAGMMKTDLLLCAHSHIQFKEKKGHRLIVNCGSVGLPCESDPRTRFAVVEYTKNGWEAELCRIHYDVDRIVREFHDSGFMEEAAVWAKVMLNNVITGREYSWECINIVNRLCRESGCSRNEEWVWEEAARQVGLL